MKKSLIALVLTGLLLAACGSSATQTPVKPARPSKTKGAPAAWTSIKMNQSGGVAGVSHTIQFGQDGNGSAIDDQTNKTVPLTLTGEQLAQLNSFINAVAKFPKVALDTSCADCFVYSLDVSFSTKIRSLKLSDTQLTASGFEPLVTFLRTLLDAALVN